MKKIFFALFAFFLSALSFAQSRQVFVDYKGAQKPAIIDDLPFPEKTISDAIKNKLEKAGYRRKESKGFDVYNGVKLSELSQESHDLYFKVERKSRKDKDASVVTMLISKGFENFIGESDDAKTISHAKAWLESLHPTAVAFDLELQVKDQEDLVGKAEKKYRNLVNDADDMQQKKKKLEDQIEENLKQQKDQQAEIEKQKLIFSTLKEKRK